MRVRVVTAEADLRDLWEAVEAANAIQCDPTGEAAPAWEALRDYAGTVVAAYDEQGPLMFALCRGGEIVWLCIVRPSKEAAVGIAAHIFAEAGSCHGVITNAAVRALFDDPHIFLGQNGMYLEWRQT